MAKKQTNSGQCMCGAVKFNIHGTLRNSVSCHCELCRRWSGHYWSATACLLSDLSMQGEDSLRWYQSSENVKRGFCQHCGSSLFWQVEGRETVSIAAGCLDLPTGIKEAKHICLDEKSDYY